MSNVIGVMTDVFYSSFYSLGMFCYVLTPSVNLSLAYLDI